MHKTASNENDRGTMCTSDVSWDKLAQALRNINYNGPLEIESFTPKVKNIASATAIWRTLASSPDILAGDGLIFLKDVIY
jgi:D-psicose/D-tagatose/L-ribulose 3-epimerase